MNLMLAGLVGVLATLGAADDGLFKAALAPIGPNNPRNTEAAIIPLKDGSLLLGWSEFYAGDGSDHGPARLCGKLSKDGGHTWGDKYTLVENDGVCNVMEVNFLRLKNGDIALFYCRCMNNKGETDCRVMMRTSSDEGKTWGPGKQLSLDNTYAALTNGRCIRLKSGRILLEAYIKGDDGEYTCYCYLSDDDGVTWRESQRIRPEGGSCYEPACIELKDGRVLMLLRTGLGAQYKSLSADGGETWSKPEPTPLTDASAPVALTRVPKTGDLLVIWNHNPGAAKRNPLSSAISKDEGATWTGFRNIEEAPDNAWAYPAVTWLGDTALVTYFDYAGGLSLYLKIIPTDWFYGNS